MAGRNVIGLGRFLLDLDELKKNTRLSKVDFNRRLKQLMKENAEARSVKGKRFGWSKAEAEAYLLGKHLVYRKPNPYECARWGVTPRDIFVGAWWPEDLPPQYR